MIAHRGLRLAQLHCTQSAQWYQVAGSIGEQKTNAVPELFGSFRDSRKSTVLSQHTESSRGGSGLGILIAKFSSKNSLCFHVCARGCFCRYCCAGCGHSSDAVDDGVMPLPEHFHRDGACLSQLFSKFAFCPHNCEVHASLLCVGVCARMCACMWHVLHALRHELC